MLAGNLTVPTLRQGAVPLPCLKYGMLYLQAMTQNESVFKMLPVNHAVTTMKKLTLRIPSYHVSALLRESNDAFALCLETRYHFLAIIL